MRGKTGINRPKRRRGRAAQAAINDQRSTINDVSGQRSALIGRGRQRRRAHALEQQYAHQCENCRDYEGGPELVQPITLENGPEKGRDGGPTKASCADLPADHVVGHFLSDPSRG